jgi:hypothetical protein
MIRIILALPRTSAWRLRFADTDGIAERTSNVLAS